MRCRVNALAHRAYCFKANVQLYIFRDLVEIVSPDKPRSRAQRYRLTEQGLELLKKMNEKR